MKNLLLLLIVSYSFSTPSGYILQDGRIQFIYPNMEGDLEVIVSGNFNNWTKDTTWKMTYKEGIGYLLEKDIQDVKSPGQSFYEFTFRVDGELTDADSQASNVIHCAGYGSRYLIRF